MITTLYFLQFTAFYLWQITSPKRLPARGLWAYAAANKLLTRLTGISLWGLAGAGFISQWGLAGGITGFLTGLMAVGCLSVLIEPFRYLHVQRVLLLYIGCVFLEIVL